MDLRHEFTVPAGIDETWAHFQDIESVAGCFPGAVVTEVTGDDFKGSAKVKLGPIALVYNGTGHFVEKDESARRFVLEAKGKDKRGNGTAGATVSGVEGDSFSGSVKVKLGPIALVYNGSGTFTEKDEAAHRFVVDAKGKDKRGNGTAGATVTLTMDGRGDSTDVKVHTDLAVTGKPAQFGRGVMQDVSDKLLGQFVACLEQRLGDSGGGAAADVADEAPPGETPPDASGTAPAAESTPPPAEGKTPPPPVTPATPPPSAPQQSAPTTPSTPQAPASSRGSDDALDLGRTVLPVLAKTYWRQAVVALIVIIVVIIWLVAL